MLATLRLVRLLENACADKMHTLNAIEVSFDKDVSQKHECK